MVNTYELTLASIKDGVLNRIQNNLVLIGALFTLVLYLSGILLFLTKNEGNYFICQFFITLLFLSIGLTITITEYSLANVKRINADITRLVIKDEKVKKKGNIDLRSSWTRILPLSILFGLTVDLYIYLTEIKFFSLHPYSGFCTHPLHCNYPDLPAFTTTIPFQVLQGCLSASLSSPVQ